MYGKRCWEPAPQVWLGSLQCYTVYRLRFDCLGMIGYILHKTISKYKAKKWWDLSLVSLQGLLFFKMCNTFKLFSFLFLSLLETHSHTGSTTFILKSWDPPGKKYANLYIYIFLSLGITTPKYQSVCVTFSLIIFFHLSQLFLSTLHSPRVVLNLRYQAILRPEKVKLNLQESWALKGYIDLLTNWASLLILLGKCKKTEWGKCSAEKIYCVRMELSQ